MTPEMTSDPVAHYAREVVFEDGNGHKLILDGWYFWDEVWCECYGPYETEVEAREALRVYAREL